MVAFQTNNVQLFTTGLQITKTVSVFIESDCASIIIPQSVNVPLDVYTKALPS